MKKQFSTAHLQTTFEVLDKKYADPKGKSPLSALLKAPAQMQELAASCRKGAYKFTPYNLKLVLKGRGKAPREISVPTFIDKGILKALDHAIKASCPIKNQTKLASFIIRDITEFLRKIPADACVMRLDIKQYFDDINHEILLNKMKDKDCPSWLMKLARAAITNPSKEKGLKTPSKRSKGIPQGTSIASYLADIYLEEFDSHLSQNCLKAYRYVDDILIFYKQKNEEKVRTLVSKKLAELKLSAHDTEGKFFKGSIYTKKGFDYLGYHFFVTPKGVRISIRDASVQRFLNSLIAIITACKKGGYDLRYGDTRRADTMCVFDLNEKITGAFRDDSRYGWLWYFRQMNDLALLEKLDRIVKNELKKDKRTRKFKIKRLKRAYYEIQNFRSSSTYILNYGLTSASLIKKYYSDLDAKIEQSKSSAKTLAAFNSFANKRLKRLILDEVRAS